MRTCPNCGEENPERFRLCGFCGTPLAPELPPQEVRKTVTIVFSDLKGSTAMGEKLDSEAVREVMTRYFDDMRAALERHGAPLRSTSATRSWRSSASLACTRTTRSARFARPPRCGTISLLSTR